MDMITRTGFSLLAEVLEYPGDELTASCRSLIGELGEGRGEAQQAIEEFLTSTESLSTSRLQEVYAGTFDVNPACCLYAAYHLHGDSYKRGAFMAGLNREYRERGFESGNDRPRARVGIARARHPPRAGTHRQGLRGHRQRICEAATGGPARAQT
jgi:nitrate reductase assembly molybdenum cofactor insertion protein NarJ